MQQPLHLKTPARRQISYFKEGGRSLLFVKQHPFICDLVLILLGVGLAVGFTSYFHRFSQNLQTTVEIDLSIWALPKYTFFSMSRGLLGYLLSLLFSLVWGFWAAKDRVAERVLIPVLDVLQSIPILGFMPGLILLLVGLFPNTNVGLELAAIVMIFTSQAWNMTFGVYHSIRIIPQEKIDCVTAYRFSRWQKMKWLEMPYTVMSLLWNSIMSMAGGWFFLMVNESFRLGDRDFRLPGLGSYMSVAAADGDTMAMIWAIVAMVLLIVFLDYFLWRPLVVWSQKFRVEDTGSVVYSDSLIAQIVTHSLLMKTIREGIGFVCCRLSKPKHRVDVSKVGDQKGILSRVGLLAVIGALVTVLVFVVQAVMEIALEQWIHLGYLTLLTLGRVICCLVLGILIAVPLGLIIGLSEKLSKRLEPVIQITASFPATLLFPMVVLFLNALGISLEIGSVVLMLMGTLWYLLFNVIAGAKAMPSDLKEVAVTFRLKTIQKLKRLYIPAVFPYFVTGLIAAAGGAWNASIVAEYITYSNQVVEVPGIGSMINLSAQNGQIGLLVASVLVMASVVVLINYQVWLRMFHYSEKRFSLNY